MNSALETTRNWKKVNPVEHRGMSLILTYYLHKKKDNANIESIHIYSSEILANHWLLFSTF